MKTKMTQLLEYMRKRVKENLDTIHINEFEVRQILTQPLSKERTFMLTNRFALSKKMLEENKENINIQILIVNFLSKFKEVPDFTEKMKALKVFEQELKSNLDDDNNSLANNSLDENSDCNATGFSYEAEEPLFDTSEKQPTKSLFELTISGDLKYNKFHPHYCDDEFFDKLLNHHLQCEEYEICAELVKHRQG